MMRRTTSNWSPTRAALLAGVSDSAIASLATFVVAIYAVQQLMLDELAAYSMVFTTFVIVTAAAQYSLFIPYEVEIVGQDDARQLGEPLRALRAVWPLLLGLTPVCLIGAVVAGYVTGTGTSWQLAASASVTGILSPIQDHVRRIMHQVGRSNLSAQLSATHAVVAIAVLIVLSAGHLPVSKIAMPFIALTSGNIGSLLFAMLITRAYRRSSLDELRQPALSDLIATGKWMAVTGIVPLLSSLIVAAGISILSDPASVGYAETARVVAQPMMVLSAGLVAAHRRSALLVGVTKERADWIEIDRRYIRAFMPLAVIYMLAITYIRVTGPMNDILLKASHVPGLLIVTMLSAMAMAATGLRRISLMGAKQESSVAAVEVSANAVRIMLLGAAATLGAMTIPIGLGLAAVMRIGAYCKIARRWWAE